MGLQHVSALIEADNRARVEAQTWGHLAPAAGRLYPGTILFAESEYGDVVVLRADFKDLPDSPWFYDDMYDFILSQKTEPGGIYQFSGTYQKDEDAAYEFDGTVEPMTPELSSVKDTGKDQPDHCPRCDSPQPHLHPAVQHEGEVQPCSDPFHQRDTPQNRPYLSSPIAPIDSPPPEGSKNAR